MLPPDLRPLPGTGLAASVSGGSAFAHPRLCSSRPYRGYLRSRATSSRSLGLVEAPGGGAGGGGRLAEEGEAQYSRGHFVLVHDGVVKLPQGQLAAVYDLSR